MSGPEIPVEAAVERTEVGTDLPSTAARTTMRRPQHDSVGAERLAQQPGAYLPDVHADADGDGITDAARVGVPGNAVPDRVPRLEGLPKKAAAVQERFASAFEANPDAMAMHLRMRMMQGVIGDAPHIFSTDEAKRMSPDFHPPKPENWAELGKKKKAEYKAELKEARCRNNIAVHQTGNALAKRAFLQHVDQAVGADPDGEHLIVATVGGCAAGKGRSIDSSPEAREAVEQATAVWDSAGEQNSSELPWLAEVAKQHDAKLQVIFVDRDPVDAFTNRVIQRAEKNGRMVDARLTAESYAIGAKNAAAFQQQHADDPDVSFMVLDGNQTVPRPIPAIPESSLNQDPDQLHAQFTRHLEEHCEDKLVKRAGREIGERIWGPPTAAA